jgi:23S rRNA pseudouridine1911/1915/1917 synthase
MKQTLQITDQDNNLRLDVYLAEHLHDISRSHIQKLIATRAVTVNGAAGKSGYKVHSGDTVDVEVPMAQPLDRVEAEAIPLDVVFEDAELIVLNKAKGMVVHPAPGAQSGTLVNALLAHCTDLSGIGGVQRPGIVHRLDKDTSGLIVVAKTDRAHRSLADQIRERVATRKYQTLLWGRVPFKHAVIDAPIMRHPVDRKRMTVYEDVETTMRYPRRETDTRLPHRSPGGLLDEDPDRPNRDFVSAVRREFASAPENPNARVAVTELRLLEHLGLFSWMEAILQTGRTHQIRVHTAFSGYPVVGDTVYGGMRRVSAEELRGYPLHKLNEMIMGLHGQALHAYSLSFDHPVTGQRMQFNAPLPAEIAELLDFLRRLDEEPQPGEQTS